MKETVTIRSPRYQQIAADIAAKIADKRYRIGDKIYARSAIASQYGVSSETARRAICILSDMNIVDTSKGSGVFITSYENAVKFVKQHQDIKSVSGLKKEIIQNIDNQTKEYTKLKKQVNELMDKVEHFKEINPFIPFETEINEKVKFIGNNLSEINFWHNTSATIIGIKHEDTLLMSPGPYAVLNKGDIIYYVGDENCYIRVQKFLFGN